MSSQPEGKLALSVIIPTLNEAEQISAAIASLDWADEVIVVDGGSTDGTVALAEAGGARAITVLAKTIGEQRNAGIEVARNKWILALDADERPGPGTAVEIASVITSGGHESYRFRLRNFYLGREITHGRWARDWHVRLFRSTNRFDSSRVHENLRDNTGVGTLRANILHTPYRDLSHHVRKIILYSRLGAEDMFARGKRAGGSQLIVNPVWRFGKDYFLNGSIRDGRVGFVMSVLSAFATFMKYANLLALELSDQIEGHASPEKKP